MAKQTHLHTTLNLKTRQMTTFTSTLRNLLTFWAFMSLLRSSNIRKLSERHTIDIEPVSKWPLGSTVDNDANTYQ